MIKGWKMLTCQQQQQKGQNDWMLCHIYMSKKRNHDDKMMEW